MTDKEQIFLKDINKTGFYCSVDDTERLYIYEVINNVSQEWIKKDPKAKLLIDQWIYDYTDYDDRKVYATSGNLEATYCNRYTGKVYKIEDTKFKIFGNYKQFLMEDKPTYKEQLARKTQECEELKDKLNTSEKWRIKAEGLNEKLDLKNTCYRKALEEIEKLCIEYTHEFTGGVTVHYFSLDEILDIINKAKEVTSD